MVEYILTSFIAANVLGRYYLDTGRVYIVRGLDKETHEWVLTHEMCHKDWFEVKTEHFRRVYEWKFEKGRTKTPTEQSRVNVEENYAENCTINNLNKGVLH